MCRVFFKVIGDKLERLAGRVGLFDASKPDKNTLTLWGALRELNQQLVARPSEPVSFWIKHTYEHLGLKGTVARNYLASVVPLSCRHDEFFELQEWADLSFLCTPKKMRNAWTLSLLLPQLIAQGKVEAASSFMLEIAARSEQGWLNTECIRFALKCVQEQESSGDLDIDNAVQFRESVLALLAALSSDWFSRLPDMELIKAAVLLLDGMGHYDDVHRNNISTAVIRYFGLSPAFWGQCPLQTIYGGGQKLQQAQQHWQTICREFAAETSHATNDVAAVFASLAWFHEQGNGDALMFLRDLSANCLKRVNGNSDVSVQLRDWLRIKTPQDNIRYENVRAIWPTYCPPVEGPNSNRLERLTSAEKAADVLTEDVVVVAVVRNEMTILPYFVAHYRKLGVGGFVFVDNVSTDDTRDYLCAQPDVVLYTTDTEYKFGCYGVAWQQAILANHCLKKWVVLADADEFLVYPDWERRSLKEFLLGVSENGADAVLTLMVDMYSPLSLDAADFTKNEPFQAAPCHDENPLLEWRLGSGQYSNGVSYLSALRHRLSKSSPPNAFTSQKVALINYKPWMRFSAGLHYAANVVLADEMVQFAHFKYHAGFKDKAREEVQRGQHYNNAEEYRLYLEMQTNLKRNEK